MTEIWSILPHRPEVFFSMLPQVFLLFHEAAKQQNLSPDNSRFSGWWGGIENSPGLREDYCDSSTQFLGALNSTGMWFLPLQLICSVSRSFVNTSVDLQSLERVLLLEVSMKCGCGKSQPVCELSMDFHTCCYVDSISCVSPWLTDFAAILACESWGMGTGGEGMFQKAPHCLLNTSFHL